MIISLSESIFEDLFVANKKYLWICKISVPPADDSVRVCSIFYPRMSKLVVTSFFCDILLSEIHNISTFVVSRLRRTFKPSICEESEDILRCSM